MGLVIFVDCPIGKFLCDNGKCIYHAFICDGHNDCGDNSDEQEVCGGKWVTTEKFLKKQDF